MEIKRPFQIRIQEQRGTFPTQSDVSRKISRKYLPFSACYWLGYHNILKGSSVIIQVMK